MSTGPSLRFHCTNQFSNQKRCTRMLWRGYRWLHGYLEYVSYVTVHCSRKLYVCTVVVAQHRVFRFVVQVFGFRPMVAQWKTFVVIPPPLLCVTQIASIQIVFQVLRCVERFPQTALSKGLVYCMNVFKFPKWPSVTISKTIAVSKRKCSSIIMLFSFLTSPYTFVYPCWRIRIFIRFYGSLQVAA